MNSILQAIFRRFLCPAYRASPRIWSRFCSIHYVKLQMDLGTVFSELQSLECELHQPKARKDSNRLAQLLHPEFHEFGRSGRAYRRAEILERLPAETQAPEIHARDFHIVQLAESVYLLTYRSAHAASSGRFESHTNRSSVWRLEPVGWQMIFHQGTPTVGFDENAI